jgi:hypothetical protein
MEKKNKGKYVMPAVVEYGLKTGESRVLEYVELTDEEYDKQVIQPLAQMCFDLLKHDMKSGRFDEIMKEYRNRK